MKKIIITYGLIASFIVSVFMVVGTYLFVNNPNFEGGEWMGYTGMLIAFIFIFVGVRNFRDKENLGVITFGKAFKIGALIALVAATFYVMIWLVEYYMFYPDFMGKYSETVIRTMQTEGATQAAIDAKTEEMKMFSEWYKNPIFIVLLTYAEILPLGLLIALISAAILKKKQAVEA